MRAKGWILAVAFAGLLPMAGSAQQAGTVTGQVVDEANQPLPAVSVTITGTGLGALTNQEGRFTIRNVPPGDREIVASRIGYARGSERVEVAAAETVVVDFTLRDTAVELEGILVTTITGQVQRRREIGTNTASLNVGEMEMAPIRTFGDVLAGRTAGVTLQQASGTTGAGQRIRIRGANSLSLSNEPLIFIDGVRITDSKRGFSVGGQDPSRLNDLNPQDIENVEVIKGPAASALYGSAAANGVIHITTRRGREGVTRWQAWAETSTIEDRASYPANWVAYQTLQEGQPLYRDGFFNADAYLACRNWQAAGGACQQDGVSSFNTLRDGRTSPFQTGSAHRFGMSAQGGGANLTYFFSVDRQGEEGVYDYSTLERTSLRGNVQADLRDDLTLNISSSYLQSDLHLNSNDNSILSPLINGLMGAPAFVESDDGDPHPNNWGWGYSQDDLRNYVPRQEVDRLTLGATADYRPIPWLSANLNVGMDYTGQHDHNTLQPDRIPIAASWAIGWRDSDRSTRHIWTVNAATTATFEPFRDIVSTSTMGLNFDRESLRATGCYGAGIVEGTSSCSATSSLFAVDEAYFKIVELGGLFRQQVGWRDRMFLAGSVRADDNSAFGEQFDLAWYPSASFSWVVGEEAWFPELPALSSLRVRSAWGTSGLRPGFRDALTLYEPVSVTSEGQELSAVTLDTQGNPLLKPERTTELELGFDAGFLDERVSLDFTWFDKRSRDALISRRVAPSFGLTSSVFDNLGRVQNTGTELGLNVVAWDRDPVRLDLRFQNSSLRNEILDIGEDVEPIIFNRGNQRHQEGFPAGAFFQIPLTWQDSSGDGRLAVGDVEAAADSAVFMGTSLPRWSRSVAADLTLWNWLRVNTLVEGRGGHMQIDYTNRFRCTTGHARGDRGCRAVWDPDAPLEEQAAVIGALAHGTNAGYIHRADFVRWRELSVSLAAPELLVRRAPQLQGLQLTLAGRNLATWTDYPGLDPEINESGASTNFTQGEFNTQPLTRHLVFRVNYSF